MILWIGDLGREGHEIHFFENMGMRKVMKAHLPTGADHRPLLSITDGFELSGSIDTGTAPGEAPAVAADDDDEGGGDDPDPARLRPRQLSLSARGKRRSAAATAGDPLDPPSPSNHDLALWRLPVVLSVVPVSRSGWWAGVKAGRYPAPVHLSTRCVAWRSADIRALIQSL